MRWWWQRKKSPNADVELLSALMKGQADAAAQRTQIEMKRQELELRRMELEFENLERLGEEKRRQKDAEQRLREQRREWAQKSREAIRIKKSQQTLALTGQECRVCRSPGEPSLTSQEITWHHQGHPGEARR